MVRFPGSPDAAHNQVVELSVILPPSIPVQRDDCVNRVYIYLYLHLSRCRARIEPLTSCSSVVSSTVPIMSLSLQPGITEEEAARVRTTERGGADSLGQQPMALPAPVHSNELLGKVVVVVREEAREAAVLAIKSVVNRMNVRGD